MVLEKAQQFDLRLWGEIPNFIKENGSTFRQRYFARFIPFCVCECSLSGCTECDFLAVYRVVLSVIDGDLYILHGEARDDARGVCDVDPRLDLPEHRPLAREAARRFPDAAEWLASG